MLCDITLVEFHAGKILHLICYKKIEIWDAVGTSIKDQDTTFSESWFDLLVGDLEVVLIIDVSGLYAESDGKLGVLILCQTDGDLWPVWPMVSAVPVFDKVGWFGFKVGTGPIHEHHVKSDIMVFFEDLQDMSEDNLSVFPYFFKTAVEGIVSEDGKMEVL
jgi:hypothetical protein